MPKGMPKACIKQVNAETYTCLTFESLPFPNNVNTHKHTSLIASLTRESFDSSYKTCHPIDFGIRKTCHPIDFGIRS